MSRSNHLNVFFIFWKPCFLSIVFTCSSLPERISCHFHMQSYMYCNMWEGRQKSGILDLFLRKWGLNVMYRMELTCWTTCGLINFLISLDILRLWMPRPLPIQLCGNLRPQWMARNFGPKFVLRYFILTLQYGDYLQSDFFTFNIIVKLWTQFSQNHVWSTVLKKTTHLLN